LPLSIFKRISGKWNQANILHFDRNQKLIFYYSPFMCSQHSQPKISRNHCSKKLISVHLISNCSTFYVIYVYCHCCLVVLPVITEDAYFTTKFFLDRQTPTKSEQAWMTYISLLTMINLLSDITFT
jgi:hypothetical protein